MADQATEQPDDKVVVNIEFTETVTYSGYKVMTRAQFEALEQRLDAGGKEAFEVSEVIGDLLDRMGDWQDASNPEVEQFFITELKPEEVNG